MWLHFWLQRLCAAGTAAWSSSRQGIPIKLHASKRAWSAAQLHNPVKHAGTNHCCVQCSGASFRAAQSLDSRLGKRHVLQKQHGHLQHARHAAARCAIATLRCTPQLPMGQVKHGGPNDGGDAACCKPVGIVRPTAFWQLQCCRAAGQGVLQQKQQGGCCAGAVQSHELGISIKGRVVLQL